MKDKKLVLAVDDDPYELNALAGILFPAYDLHTAKSASDALASLNSKMADIIVLDADMPNISGFEFLRDIRKIPSYMNIPVIIVNDKTGQEFFHEAKNSSAFAVLSKPVIPEKLTETIKNAIAAM